MQKPNFFIVGAAKSGTTSLAYYLGQHPDIYMSPLKEPFYFIPNAGYSNYSEYMALFKKSGTAVAVGEASTGYLYCRRCPVLIHEFNPTAKIIIILRNPVNMAYSYWRYMRRAGNENKSFQEAISMQEREKRRSSSMFKKTCSHWWGSFLYIDRAMYYEQVQRYMDTFPKNQVKILIFEEFIREPIAACKDIFRFLEVKESFIPLLKVKNIGGEPRFEFIKKILLCKNYKIRSIVKAFLPVETRVRIKNGLLSLNTSASTSEKINDMDETTRKYLQEIFQKDILKLEELIRRPIPEWKD